MKRSLIAVWGVGGVLLLLSQALWRLTPLALDALRSELTPWQWALTAAWVVAMAHAEGYRGFHRRFSPRVVARAQHLAGHSTPLRVALAPLYCMSLFGSSRRGMLVARLTLGGIIVLIAIVRMLDQPWRGIIDAGVVVGLAIGMLSIAYYAARAVGGKEPAVPADLPPDEQEQT